MAKGYNVEPQLIAEAFTTFYKNNGNYRLTGLPKLTFKRMLGIVTIGSATTIIDPTVREMIDCPTHPING